jgi:hypothetical protein
MVALELQTTVVGESFKEKSSDLTTVEVYLKGAAFVCPRWSAQLEAKCHGRTFKLPVPSHRLPSKLVSRQQMARPRSRSLHPVHTVSLPPIFATLLLLLQIAPVCPVDSSGQPGVSMWMSFVVALDVVSSWPRCLLGSCHAASF